jgi:hypothetical protein
MYTSLARAVPQEATSPVAISAKIDKDESFIELSKPVSGPSRSEHLCTIGKRRQISDGQFFSTLYDNYTC